MSQLTHTLACVLTCVLAVSTAARQVDASAESLSSRSLTPEEALETFEHAWRVIHETHFDEEFNGVDWVALREEMLPRVREVQEENDLRGLLTEMIQRLGQSHFALLPRGASREEPDEALLASLEGGFGFDVRYRGGELLVTRVDEAGPAERAGIRPGWVLLEVGQESLDDLLEKTLASDPRHRAAELRDRARLRLFGEIGSTDRLEFLDAQRQAVELALERAKRDVVVHTVGHLPTFHLRFESRHVERNGQELGVVHFSNWFTPMMDPVNRAIDEMRSADGIVIDLRGNSGGSGPMILGVAGHFFDERRELGVQMMRGSSMRFVALPQRVNPDGEPVEPFQGPVAILVDELTGSASEVFAGGMQSVGRARVFGETSAGAVLPGRTTSLPNGDSLLHAIGDFRTATGTMLEGRGVIPDEIVPLTRESLLSGNDPQLERALEWLVSASH